MNNIIILTVAFAAIYAVSALDCAGKPDGVYNWGCRAYSRCVKQKEIRVDCQPGKVYNQDKQECDDPLSAPPPCGLWRNCKASNDGRYPDLERRCEYYYTCHKQNFLGHNPCPIGLVFDAKAQLCNWPFNVAPPCGTRENKRNQAFAADDDNIMYLDCTGKPDGVYEWGCKAYTMCISERPVTIECTNGTVYNHLKEHCDDPKKTPAPCGVWRNCTGKVNGRYADVDRACRYYFTCHEQEFFGHNPCPGELVFDEKQQLCNWIFNVPPPCGTKKPEDKSLLRLLKRKH